MWNDAHGKTFVKVRCGLVATRRCNLSQRVYERTICQLSRKAAKDMLGAVVTSGKLIGEEFVDFQVTHPKISFATLLNELVQTVQMPFRLDSLTSFLHLSAKGSLV